MPTSGFLADLRQKSLNLVCDKTNDGAEGEQVFFSLETVELGHEMTAPVVRLAEPPAAQVGGGPKLDQKSANHVLVIARRRASGLTTEQRNERARNEGVGLTRKADLYDIREALKSKGLVRQYGDRWNVS